MQGVSLSITRSMDMQRVSLSIASSMDVQSVPFPFHSHQNGHAACNHIYNQEYTVGVQCAGCMPLHCQDYRHAECVPFYRQQYGRAGCNSFLNAGLSGIQLVRYGNEQKFRCRNQSVTGIMGPCLVAEFRYRTEILEQC
jgi:hypothetical protein